MNALAGALFGFYGDQHQKERMKEFVVVGYFLKQKGTLGTVCACLLMKKLWLYLQAIHVPVVCSCWEVTNSITQHTLIVSQASTNLRPLDIWNTCTYVQSMDQLEARVFSM